MPEGLRSSIETKLHSRPEYGKHFSQEDISKTLKCLAISFNFRPDLGYRPGLDSLVLILRSSQMTIRKCVKILLDICFLSPYYHALISGDLFVLKQVYGRLKRQLAKRLPKWAKIAASMEDSFHSLSANFFGQILSLKSMRKLLDLFVLFGTRAFIFLFIEILAQIPTQEGPISAPKPADFIKYLGDFQQRIIFDNLRAFLVQTADAKRPFWVLGRDNLK